MANIYKPQRISWLKKLSMYLPMACAVHCMAMPLLLVVLPMTGISIVQSEMIEWTILGSAFLLSSFFVLRSYFSVHKNLWIPAGLLLGFLLMSASHFMHFTSVDKVPLIFGAILVYYVLRQNEKLSSSCNTH